MGYQKKFEKQYQYVIDCMEPDDMEGATVEEKLKYLMEVFVHFSTEWKKQQFPYRVSRMADMLRGLPSACSIDFETYRIFQVGQEWGYISNDITTEWLPEILEDKDAARFIDKWYDFIAQRIFDMFDYYDIKFIG